MKANKIRITEEQLRQLVFETYKKVLKEDGITAGSAAANAAGTPNGATNALSNQTFDVPFGGVQRRKGYSPKGKNSSKMTEVDMEPALARHDGKGGSISIPKKRVGESYIRIKAGELRETVNKDEFRPVVFGDKESDKINKQAYADIKKETGDYDGGLSRKSNGKGDSDLSEPATRGMSDLHYDAISKPFSDNVKAQIKGYANKQAEKLHGKDDKGGNDFEGNENILKNAEKHADDVKTGRTTASAIGLTGREIDKKKYDDLKKNVFESSGKMTVISFKKEKFLSEGHMLSRIPDDYKQEGKRFVMKDNSGNEYLVEWHQTGSNVTKKTNMQLVNEEKERIKELWGYKPSEHDTNTTNASRLNESGDGYRSMFDRARQLMK